MRRRRTGFAAVALTLALSAACAAAAGAQPSGFMGFPSRDGKASGTIGGPSDGLPRILDNVRFDQKLNTPLPLDLTFADEAGRPVRLGDFFGRRPVVLTLVYYSCPMLCTQVLNGLVTTLNGMNLQAGRDFEVVTVSFNPEDTPALAAAKKANYMEHVRQKDAAAGWHFLTGDTTAIRRLTDTAGFRYVKDPKSSLYAHASGIMVVTTDGRLSRYFFGVDYPARDVRLALVEASSNRIGTVADQLLLFCFHYDPATGRYGRVTMGALRLAGVLTLVTMGAGIGLMVRRERHRSAA